MKRFEQIPHTGHLQIWLQRVTFPISKSYDYEERLCKYVIAEGELQNLWNFEWLNQSLSQLMKIIEKSKIVDYSKLDTLVPIIPIEQVNIFGQNIDY